MRGQSDTLLASRHTAKRRVRVSAERARYILSARGRGAVPLRRGGKGGFEVISSHLSDNHHVGYHRVYENYKEETVISLFVQFFHEESKFCERKKKERKKSVWPLQMIRSSRHALITEENVLLLPRVIMFAGR